MYRYYLFFLFASLFIVCLFLPDVLPVGTFVSAGVLSGGVFGEVKGKIGGTVSSTWKGINTIRAYKVPANPNSTAQQAQRSRFSACQSFASQLLSTLINTYWNPFAVKMSGYNYFIQQNIKLLASDTYYLTTANYMSVGTLEPVTDVAGTLDTGVVTITWDETIVGNGLLTDGITAVVVNKETFATYITESTDIRNDETIDVTVTGESDATKLIGFIIANRGTGSSFVVSDSVSAQITAA